MISFPLIPRLTLVVLCLACWLDSASRAQAPKALPRIAIIAANDGRDAALLADLLTAAMSQNPQGYELVERAELNRLAQEAEVQRMNVAERPRALARLAKADGLIVLSAEPTGPGRRTISVRLSSTATALILKTFVLAADDAELPTSAKLAADALSFAVGRVHRAGSAPAQVISLLGIRANVSSSPGVAIETVLNAAITHHLSGIPGLAVVERWKLDDVAFERSLSEKDMPPLATGTLLVDGSLEAKDKTATAKVRLRKSQDDSGKVLSIEGPADDALLLAKNIAIQLAAECGNNAMPVPWDTQAEASAYAKLGGWLLNHRMGREAAEAYESAVTLGDNSPETIYKRIYAYAVLANPKGSLSSRAGFNEIGIFSHPYSQIEADRERFPLVLASISRVTAYAEDLFQKPWKPYAGAFWTSRPYFADDLAILSCQPLVAAHRLKLHVRHSAEIQALRQRAEFFAKLHEKERKMNARDRDDELDVLAGYWSASPEQAAEYWHHLLTNAESRTPQRLSQKRYGLAKFLKSEGFGYPRTVRKGMPIEPPRPVFIDWSTPDNARGERCWKNLLDQLGASKSLVNQFDGIALAIHTRPPGEERDNLLLSYLDFFERNHRFLNEPEGQAVFCAFFAQGGPLGYPPTFAERYAGLVEALFGSSSRVEGEDFAPIRNMLDRMLLRYPPGAHVLPKTSAKRALHAIRGYAERTQAANDSTIRRYQFGGTPEDLMAAITRAYPDLKMPAPAQTPAPEFGGDSIPVRFLAMASETTPADTRFWIYPSWVSVCGDRLFVMHSDIRRLGSTLIGKDLTKSKIPPIPEGLFHSPNDSQVCPERFLQPTKNGFLTLSCQGMLLGYDFQAGRWSDESGLLPEHLRNTYQENLSAGRDVAPHYSPPVIGLVNDTLYIATADNGHTIGRMMNGKYELIASSRRRPAEHPRG